MTEIIFFGTPRFVIPIAEALKKAPRVNLAAVVTAPDKPVGRKQILTPSPIKTWAFKHQIPVLTPKKLDQDFLNLLISQYPDIRLGILAAYGKIIPQELINLFPKGILVIHPSLLPQYRGASPVQATILAGEEKTGVSIIRMDERIDHGPIISQFTEPIKPEDTSETLYTRLFQKAAEVLITILPAWLEDKITPREQNHTQATFTHILKRKDGYIDLEKPPLPGVFERMVRAYQPWPGVWSKFKVKNEKFKVIKFLPEEKIQLEGGKPMSLKDFLNGYPEAKTWLLKLLPS